jgi:hypothetical protein
MLKFGEVKKISLVYFYAPNFCGETPCKIDFGGEGLNAISFRLVIPIRISIIGRLIESSSSFA